MRHPNPPEHASRNIPNRIELYSRARFIAWGTNQTGAIAERCAALPAFIAKWFPPRPKGSVLENGDGPCPGWNGPADDEELLRRALASRSAASVFGAKATFADIYLNDVEVLRTFHPGDGEDGIDRSSVDAACAQHLAFWSGRDEARMHRLMLRSSLGRNKWEREDYLPRTIANACAMQRDVLQDKPVLSPLAAPEPAAPQALALAAPAPAAERVALDATMTKRTDRDYLRPEDMPAHFAGCIYISDLHKVLCPGGKLYRPEQFKAVYGGRSFVMDDKGVRVVRDAFEAFTQNQAVQCARADGTCFRPDLAYGAIVTNEGRSRANVYSNAEVDRMAGDPGPFLEHLET